MNVPINYGGDALAKRVRAAGHTPYIKRWKGDTGPSEESEGTYDDRSR